MSVDFVDELREAVRRRLDEVQASLATATSTPARIDHASVLNDLGIGSAELRRLRRRIGESDEPTVG